MSNKCKESQTSIDKLKDDLAAEVAHTSQIEAHLTTFLNTRDIDDEVVQILKNSLKRNVDERPSANKMQDMVSSLSANLAEVEQKNIDLQHDIRLLEKVGSDSLRALSGTQKEMIILQEDVAKLYARI